MQHYLQLMHRDMELRGFTASTKDYYPRYISRFLKHWGKPPEEANEKDLCTFLYHLLTVEKLNPSTVNQCNSALRFFYEVTLNRTLNLRALPRFNEGYRIPEILTQDEVMRIINACSNLKHKCVLITLYSSGIRLAELTNLKISDVDSKDMRLFIRQGKCKKDRYAILSKVNLNILREYYKAYRPKDWLFEGRAKGSKYTNRSVQLLISKYSKIAGITKHVTVHTFRHCFATHMLQSGIDVLQVKQLLGHSSIASTMRYLHLANSEFQKITAPIDILMGGSTNG